MSLALLWVVLWSPQLDGELDRLVGQKVTVTGDDYVIDDIAGEGKPIVGVVDKRGDALWVGGLRLTGPLAVPRIAGPGYKVWILGAISGDAIEVRRLGVLRPPAGGT
jgi:hypothetical protein